MNGILLDSALLAIVLIISILGIVLCKKFHSSVKDQDRQEQGKIIQTLLKRLTLVQSVGWPILLIGTWVLHINKYRLNTLGVGFVQVGVMSIRDIRILLRNYVGFQSFVIALCRYLFIVKDSLLMKIGVKRLRYIILLSSGVIPICQLLLGEATAPIGHVYFCILVPQDDQLHKNNNTSGMFCNQETITKSFESPFYTFCWENLPLPVNYALLMIRYILFIMGQSNILEGFMYIHIFTFIWR